jgi:hypothetical protein
MRVDPLHRTAVALGVVEGAVLGYVFRGQSDIGYWLLTAVVVAIVTVAVTIVINAIARSRFTPRTAAGVALVIGALAGLVGAYLIQPVGGPT